MSGTKYILKRMMALSLLASVGFTALLSLAQTEAAFAATAPSLGSTSAYGVVSSTFTNSNTAPQTIINGGVCYTTPPVTPPLSITGTTTTPCPPATGVDQGLALANLLSQPCTFLGPGAIALDSVIIGANPPGTIPPGCYSSGGAMNITATTTVTLSGAGVYIFRPGGALTTGANSEVVLAGGVCENDVFWAPVGATTLGANATPSLTPTFVGNILDNAGITLGHFANLTGRALDFATTVTTDANTITVPTCVPFVPGVAPTIDKAFNPLTINAGGVSTLTFTLSNANATPVTNVSFTDTYPAGLINATTANVVNTCGGTVQGGASGGTTIGLSGVTISAGSSCTISVKVTSALVNSYTNVSSAVNSDQGTGNSASATLVVIALSQPLLITQVFSPGVTLGAAISDIATLSGGTNPTGTITFNLYGPNNATCAGAPIFTSAVAVSGNGNYPSGSFTPTTAGTYRWIANYGGDANNAATANTCNALNETVVVAQLTPALTTQASPGVNLGLAISDTATLSGGTNPTGTITFSLYGPNDATCAGLAIGSVVAVSGNGIYPSGSFTPAAEGTYRWIANYSGDTNNAPTANTCNALNENVVVAQPPKVLPTLTTQASSGVTLGAAISDTATLSGGTNPTGTITFNLYGPNDATCTGAVIFTSAIAVSGNGNYPSGPFTPTTAGTYRWIANYGGDTNNAPTANFCNALNENVVVAQRTTALTTQASSAVTLGAAISDTGTLSGGTNPTGTITFNLYGPNDATCTGAVSFTSKVQVNGNGNYPSGSFTPTSAGIYRWIANYSGDTNNAPTANTCNGANENVVVAKRTPALTTQASPLAVGLGAAISDTATLSGGANPTGTITFSLYGPNNATCAGLAIFTSSVAVSGNGNYPSGSFTPTTEGTYRWIANYSGDANNEATANACNALNENVGVFVSLTTVPTLSEWGMIIFMLLVGLMSVYYVRRQKAKA